MKRFSQAGFRLAAPRGRAATRIAAFVAALALCCVFAGCSVAPVPIAQKYAAQMNEYAELAVQKGAAIQPGQTLVIHSPVECAAFAELCADKAYEAGAAYVTVQWADSAIKRGVLANGGAEQYEKYAADNQPFYENYLSDADAHLYLLSDDPNALAGVDPAALSAFSKVNGAAMAQYNKARLSFALRWSIVGIPNQAWAQQVFPDKSADEALDSLWDAVLKTARVDGSGNCIQVWDDHLAEMDANTKRLNELDLASLHYTNSLGTDLTIELPEGYRFMSGGQETPDGQFFIPNIPTEEVFSAPLRTGVNGVVYASLPLVYNGTVIEGISFTLKDGKIVESHADKNGEVLEQLLDTDANARYLGEVALVPYDSPISQMGTLFYNTLYDENASCHLAFGSAYADCLAGGVDMTDDELLAHGLNVSSQHIDFMVGTADLSIVGTTRAGEQVVIFKDGNFAW